MHLLGEFYGLREETGWPGVSSAKGAEENSAMVWWAIRTTFLWAALCIAAGAVFSGYIDTRMFGWPSGSPGSQAASANLAGAQVVQDDASSGLESEMIFRASQDGHFYIDADVNGREITFMVDTGASVVTLSRDDALRVGINPRSLDYRYRSNTANGVVGAAPVKLRDVRIGQLRVADVGAAVLEGNLHISLLGMSFLSRLNGYEVRNGKLILRW